MPQSFQGKALKNWSKAVDKVPEFNRIVDKFSEAQREYLEKIAEINNIGEYLIRQLLDSEKPAAMYLDDYLD